jgi:hypothetical protein
VAQGAWLLSLAIACSSNGDEPGSATRIRDTTGAEFEFATEAVDTLQPVGGLAIECSGKQIAEFRFVRGQTGLAMVCGIDPNSQGPADYLCRPIACAGAAECPRALGCDQGLCQPAGSDKIHSLELLARCLGATPRFPRCGQAYADPSWGMVSRVLLTECDAEGMCTVPTECL